MHQLPNLPYDYDALEPWFDEATMRLHHGKHHQSYVDKLNKALEGYPVGQTLSLLELLRQLDQVPEVIRQAVRNYGGGHFNHSLFWQLLTPPLGQIQPPAGELLELLEKNFGGFADFQAKFKEAALNHFGSGWAWLVVEPTEEKLTIVTTANQDNPVSEGKKVILGVDVWEHAYYLKYQNRRPDYLDAWFNLINWPEVIRLLKS